MKKLLILFIILASCEKEETPQPQESEYAITITNDCETTANSTFTTYCISEGEYESVIEDYNSFPPGASIGCEYTVSFTDLSGNKVEGYFKSGKKAPGACS